SEMSSHNDVKARTADPLAVARQYPFERSFVVQLRSDADPAAGAVCGRAEHVVSSRAVLFDSLADLARFFAEAIAAGSRALLVLGLLLASAASAQRAPTWNVPIEQRDVELESATAKGAVVYVAGREQVDPAQAIYRGVVAALDAVSGAVLWVGEGETATDNTGGATSDSTLGPLALGDGVVVAGGVREVTGPALEGVVRAYDQATGTLLWAKRIANAEETQVAVSEGIAFAATLRSSPRGIVLEAYDIATGELLWDETLGGALALPRFGAIVAAPGAVAVVGSDADETGGTFVSVHDPLTGALLWDDVRDEEGEREFGFAAAVSGSRLFVGGVQVDAESDGDELLLAYDVALGTPLWARAEPRDGSQQVVALVANGAGLVSLVREGDDYTVRARRARTGAPRWDETIDVAQGFGSRALAAKGRRIVVGVHSGVFAFDARTGRRVWNAVRDAFGVAIRGKQAFAAGFDGAAAYPLR
ncbi:MAG TPA: PQQ-binding-like beta-propeller repeat protein, partial [Myxococcota bacterium]|nr:PQQ-binding-like beta-propeller repeat protein [Myxococcota bacterium]